MRKRGTYRGPSAPDVTFQNGSSLIFSRAGPPLTGAACESVDREPITLGRIWYAQSVLMQNVMVLPVAIMPVVPRRSLKRISMGTIKDANDIEEFHRCMGRQREYALWNRMVVNYERSF